MGLVSARPIIFKQTNNMQPYIGQSITLPTDQDAIRDTPVGWDEDMEEFLGMQTNICRMGHHEGIIAIQTTATGGFWWPYELCEIGQEIDLLANILKL